MRVNNMDTSTSTNPPEILSMFEKPTKNLSHYYYYENGFTHEECDKIVNTFKNICNDDATVFSKDSQNIRKTKITWIPYNNTTRWIYDKIFKMAVEANNTMFNLTITNIRDCIQFGVYDSSFGGKYGEHIDIGANEFSQRKLSVCVQLSDPSDYEGGELYIRKCNTPNGKGSVSVFPSFLEHRVETVTSGIRYSLVLWLCGPSFH